MGNAMGNLLAECRRVSIDQCELCTDVLAIRSGQRGTTRHVPVAAGSEAELAAGRGGARGAARSGQDFALGSNGEAGGGVLAGVLLDDDDPSLMAAIAASYASGSPRGVATDEELVAQAIRRAKNEEESRQRARLLEEQATEYEESLRIDQQRELEKALRKKEEEEAERKAAEEQEEQRLRAEQEAAEAAAAEEARRTKVDRVVAEAKELLSPEPEKGEAGRVEVMIKTPDGRRLKRAFLGADCVAQIYHFANAEGGEDIAGKDYRFVSTMPRCVYEDREATLEAAGLKGQCALLMEITEEEEEEG